MSNNRRCCSVVNVVSSRRRLINNRTSTSSASASSSSYTAVVNHINNHNNNNNNNNKITTIHHHTTHTTHTGTVVTSMIPFLGYQLSRQSLWQLTMMNSLHRRSFAAWTSTNICCMGRISSSSLSSTSLSTSSTSSSLSSSIAIPKRRPLRRNVLIPRRRVQKRVVTVPTTTTTTTTATTTSTNPTTVTAGSSNHNTTTTTTTTTTKNNNNNNNMKLIDEEWDEYIKNLDPDLFVEPFQKSNRSNFNHQDNNTNNHHHHSNHNKLEPWKTILEYPARAAWRVSSSIPPYPFQYAYQQIITQSYGLTKKQTSRKIVRHTLEQTIVPTQHQLQLLRDKERQQIVFSSQQQQQQNQKSSSNTNTTTTTTTTNDSTSKSQASKKIAASSIAYGPAETMAIYYFRTYTYFTITVRILQETISLLLFHNNNNNNNHNNHNNNNNNNNNNSLYNISQTGVRRIYDFGIGTGSATAAAVHVFHNNTTTGTTTNTKKNTNNSSQIEWIHGIDPSQTMRECSKFFLQQFIHGSQQPPPPLPNQNNDDDDDDDTTNHDPNNNKYRKNKPNKYHNNHNTDETQLHGQEPIQNGHDISINNNNNNNNTTLNMSSLSSSSSPPPPPPLTAPLGMPQMTFSSHASSANYEAVSNNDSNSSSSSGGGGNFDLSFLTYTGMELAQSAAILGAAAICYDKLRIGGVFVMIEPGTPDGFTNVRMVRNMLLDCYPEMTDPTANCNDVREICHVIAPCTHNGKCPLERFKKYHPNYKKKKLTTQHDVESNDSTTDADADWDHSDSEDDSDDDDDDSDVDDDDDGNRKGYCSFVHSMPGGAGKGEKFSYLVVQKRLSSVVVTGNDDTNHEQQQQPRHSFDDVDISSLLQTAIAKAKNISDDSTQVLYSDDVLLKQAVDIENRFLASDDDDLGLELVRGKRETYGRIIRAPRKHRGHVLIDTCAAPGKIVRTKIMRSTSKQYIPGIYPASRKSRWGGLWPTVPNLLVRWKE